MAGSMRFYAAVLLIVSGLALEALRPYWFRGLGVEISLFGSRPQSSVVLGTPTEAAVRASRIKAKFQVVVRLVMGELGLLEAATHFRSLNHEPPEFPQLSYRQLPGETEEEKLCREVILWVETHVNRQKPLHETDKLIAGLEAELAVRLSAGGRFELPELQ